MAAFGTLYELKVLFADHITKIPLGYHLTIGSGRLRKIMDENIESVEGFIAHQFPDFVASITAPIVMVIILLAVDWRFGLASLVGIILAFVAEFIGFGSGEMKENMGKYQKALEEMNNASVEYVRGMSVVKAFNQTASSFKKLKEAIAGYTEWVLKFSLGWQNCMPAFTTIINNVYLILVPVGILIGSRSDDFAGFAMTFIFYLLFVPAISGVLNKIMYISESFMQIDGNVARMDEILNIPEMPETSHPKKPVGDDVAFHDVSFSYTGDVSEKALENVSFSAKQGQITAIVGPSGGGKTTLCNLIPRFYEVTGGRIFIDGQDIQHVTLKSLREDIGIVQQDVFLFAGTILDNIRYLLCSEELRDRVIIRTPLIPEMTARSENITAIAQFLQQCYKGVRYELLNYNPLAKAKYDYLDMEYCFDENPKLYTKEAMESFYRIARDQGIRNLIIE